jgi:hypothetical protein
MKAWHLFFLFNFMIMVSFASDTLVIRKNHIYTGKILKISDRHVYFLSTERVYKIPAKHVNSLKFSDTLDPVFISYIQPKELNNCQKGTNDARKFHKGNGYLASGILIGPFAILVAVIDEPKPSAHTINDNNLINNPEYLKCYATEAQKKNIVKAITGCGIQTIISTVAIILIINDLTSSCFDIEDYCW